MKKVISVFILMIMMVICLTGCTDESVNNSNKSSSNTKKANTSANSTTSKNSSSGIDYIAAAEKQMAEPTEGEEIAIFHIKDFGDVYVKLFPDVAPKAVENFVTHSKNGYYNGIIFHRVIENFMIQGGDPEGTGMGGESIWGKDFAEEIDESIKPYRGSLCMASKGTANSPSLGSQFFITQASYNEQMVSYLKKSGASTSLLDAYKKYGGDIYDLYYYDKYTVFGQVFKGMDVVDKIAAVETNSNDKPLTDVVIESIEITNYSK